MQYNKDKYAVLKNILFILSSKKILKNFIFFIFIEVFLGTLASLNYTYFLSNYTSFSRLNFIYFIAYSIFSEFFLIFKHTFGELFRSRAFFEHYKQEFLKTIGENIPQSRNISLNKESLELFLKYLEESCTYRVEISFLFSKFLFSYLVSLFFLKYFVNFSFYALLAFIFLPLLVCIFLFFFFSSFLFSLCKKILRLELNIEKKFSEVQKYSEELATCKWDRFALEELTKKYNKLDLLTIKERPLELFYRYFDVTGSNIRFSILPIFSLIFFSFTWDIKTIFLSRLCLSLLQEVWHALIVLATYSHEFAHLSLDNYLQKKLKKKFIQSANENIPEHTLVNKENNIMVKDIASEEKLVLNPKTQIFSFKDYSFFEKAVVTRSKNIFYKVYLPKNFFVLTEKTYFFKGTFLQQLFYPSMISENVDSTKKIFSLLEKMSLSFLKQFVLEKKKDVVDWSHKLSIGQKQRVCLIRAILNNAKFLFLEKTTASLNKALEKKYYNLLIDEKIDYVTYLPKKIEYAHKYFYPIINYGRIEKII